jgi:hypothetical protein
MRQIHSTIAPTLILSGRVIAEFEIAATGIIDYVRVKSDNSNSNGLARFDVRLDGISVYADDASRPTIVADGTLATQIDLIIPVTEGQKCEVVALTVPSGGIGGKLYMTVRVEDGEVNGTLGLGVYIRDLYQGALARDATLLESDALATALTNASEVSGSEFIREASDAGWDIFGGAEYIARARTNAQFVADVYLAMMGRVAESGGITAWVAVLVGGATREAVFYGIVGSQEFYRLRMPRIRTNALIAADAGSIRSINVPFGTPADGETLVYDASLGTWVFGAGSGGSGARSDLVHTTASLANLAVATTTVALGKTAAILRVTADRACRLRLYSTAAHRTADAARPADEASTDEHTPILEIIFTASLLTVDLPRMTIIANLEASVTGDIPALIQNTSGSTHTVALTFTELVLES